MAERIRAVLVSSYAGAIMVGWTLANGITNLVALVMMPVVNLAMRYSNRATAGQYAYPEAAILQPIELGVAAVKTAMIIGIGLLLLKWIYIPTVEVSPREDAAESAQ